MPVIGQLNIDCKLTMKAVFHHLALRIQVGPVQEYSAVQEGVSVTILQPVLLQELLITVGLGQEEPVHNLHGAILFQSLRLVLQAQFRQVPILVL